MESFFVVLTIFIFSMPVAIVGLLSHYRYKRRQPAAGAGQADQKLLARCEELEARVQTLETIVCEGDLEAAAKMRALTAAPAKQLAGKPGDGD